MSAISVTAAQVGLVDPSKATIKTLDAAETITKGQALYITTAGKYGVADVDAGSRKEQFRGIALNGGGAGQAIDAVTDGEVYGFDLSGLAYDARVYLSATAGALDTAAGSIPTVAGRVAALNDKAKTKVLHVHVVYETEWA